jgi:hypothetical protein
MEKKTFSTISNAAFGPMNHFVPKEQPTEFEVMPRSPGYIINQSSITLRLVIKITYKTKVFPSFFLSPFPLLRLILSHTQPTTI